MYMLCLRVLFLEFEDWLNQIETDNNLKYSKHRGIKRNSDDTKIIYYNCSRSGKQNILTEDVRKRSLKVQGSAKLELGCTSQIKLTKNVNGDFNVNYFKEHYGHKYELKHLNLSENCEKKLLPS
ncbi:hypothetical protein NQ317_010893 [Molorchus minor]|uniref:Uncharacterized protein n=1 Tax=Molorchus minor TaxID=1323400 RepID=A0ABQ9ISE4_9CUCU|nr:hypothetical protein NQ317_010893 [Molorchus minor]